RLDARRTLKSLVADLRIKQRKWYVNSLRSPIQAKYDKATFQKGGKVPEERIRDYLAAAGWKCVQPELWEKT
ncbi:hypothetical protein, partial [Bacteroides intestinalis]